MMRRVLEPIILGVLANIIVNYLLKPIDPDWVLKEFVVAIFLALLMTESSRAYELYLNKTIPWISSPRKRFIIQFGLLWVTVILIVNVVGNFYWYFIEHNYFTFNELALVSFVTAVMVFLLTLLNWTLYFYNNWQGSNQQLDKTIIKLENIKSIISPDNTVKVNRGNKSILLKINEVKMALVENGLVWLFTSEEKYLYSQTLKDLELLLNKEFYFRISRDAIIHKDVVAGYASSTFGKIDVTNNLNDRVFTVSRPKAASFRNWV